MDRNQFYFAPELHEIAKESGVADIAQKIKDNEPTPSGEEPECLYNSSHDSRSNVDGYLDYYFQHTEEFKELQNDEQDSAYAAFNMTEQDNWLIHGEEKEGHQISLFADYPHIVQTIAGQIPSIDADRVTLSGGGALGYQDYAPGLFARFEQYGFESKLAFMQFAGAWICNLLGTHDDASSAPKITLPDIDTPELEREIRIGGFIHGDFRMKEVLIPALGAMTPLGQKVMYAPNQVRANIAAYHSTEKLIVNAICVYAIDSDNLTPREKQVLFESLLSEQQPKVEREVGSNFYSDFGDDESDDRIEAITIDGMRLQHSYGRPYAVLRVDPLHDWATLTIQKTESGDLELKNNYNKQDSIRFRPTEIPQLLELFTKIGAVETRTSESSVLHSIRCAYEQLQAGNEPGAVIYSDTE